MSLPASSQPSRGLAPSASTSRFRVTGAAALRSGGPILFAIVAIAIPMLVSGYALREATAILMFMTLALSWNLVGGLCGYPSFGNVAFFGIGAYVTAGLVANLHWPFFPAAGVAALSALGFAAVIGPVVLRLHGHYFAIATLGTAQALGQIVIMVPWVGGPNGIILRVPYATSGQYFYYLMAGALGGALLITYAILRGSWGYACRMIRQDEIAAAASGVNTTFYKTACWSLSAFVAALVGGVYALWITFVNPPSVFDPLISLTMVVLALVGGAGTLWGPVLGAFLVENIDQYLWARLLTAHTLFLGLVIVVIVLFLPRGIWPYLTGQQGLAWRSLFEGTKRLRV
ncbi:MAG TPA: branched-chain amino acid ABC transporter permease [bacterium]|nr:branched-chain amino acid ABC transporter permease [bacterium]